MHSDLIKQDVKRWLNNRKNKAIEKFEETDKIPKYSSNQSILVRAFWRVFNKSLLFTGRNKLQVDEY